MAMAGNSSRRQALRLLGAAATGGALLAAGCTSRSQPPGPPRVGLLQYVRAAAPDDARRGVVQALARGGFAPANGGVILLERVAAGSMATCRSQVMDLLEAGVDLLVAIGTPPLAAILALAPARVPVVFCYCSNPWGAGAGSRAPPTTCRMWWAR